MEFSKQTCIRAMKTKDPKFDGMFFIGVHSTGIYCRPICPAPSPKINNIEFYPSAAAAADAGLRPCLRCRPELAPGINWMEGAEKVKSALKLIKHQFPEVEKISFLANKLAISQRHLRRLFQKHLGTTLQAVIKTERVHFAKRLIDHTHLSMTEIAYAAGFQSIRSFNHTFKKLYKRTPSELRKTNTPDSANKNIALQLFFRTPFNWKALLEFLSVRAIPGVELVSDEAYLRVINIGSISGFIKVYLQPSLIDKALITAEISFPDSQKLFQISEKIKNIFDLESPANEIDGFLKKDSLLKKSVNNNKGIRVPGAWDSFELCVRAILGQQISVKAATTISGRIVEKYGTVYQGPVLDNHDMNWYSFPKPEVLSCADLEGVGLTRTRIETIKGLSTAFVNKDIDFEDRYSTAECMNNLMKIKGIGDWTAQYIAMRVLRDPDAFPYSDLGLIKAASLDNQKIKPQQLNQTSNRWRPWRATAAMYLWRML